MNDKTFWYIKIKSNGYLIYDDFNEIISKLSKNKIHFNIKPIKKINYLYKKFIHIDDLIKKGVKNE